MLSAGGPMVGKMWSEIPRQSQQWMDNDHFPMCIQLRLALVEAPPGTTCQLDRQGDSEDRCLTAMTNRCVRLHECKVGPARLRPRRAVMISFKKILERAGADFDLERALPYLYRV